MKRNPLYVLAWGLLLLIGGAVLTGATYLFAAIRGSGVYYAFAGAMFWGGIQIVRGLVGLPRYLAAQGSGDAWERAQYDRNLLAQLVVSGLGDADADVRATAASYLGWLAVTGATPPLTPLYVRALLDPHPLVRQEGFAALWAVAQYDRRAGLVALANVAQTVAALPAATPYLAQLRAALGGLAGDKRAYEQWRKTGAIPPHPASQA